MTKFIYFNNALVDFSGCTIEKDDNFNNRGEMGIVLSRQYGLITCEYFKNDKQQRDARFEELKNMLCGEKS